MASIEIITCNKFTRPRAPTSSLIDASTRVVQYLGLQPETTNMVLLRSCLIRFLFKDIQVYAEGAEYLGSHSINFCRNRETNRCLECILHVLDESEILLKLQLPASARNSCSVSLFGREKKVSNPLVVYLLS